MAPQSEHHLQWEKCERVNKYAAQPLVRCSLVHGAQVEAQFCFLVGNNIPAFPVSLLYIIWSKLSPFRAGNGEESILCDPLQDCRFPVFGNVFQIGCITQGPAQGAGQEVHPCMNVGKSLNRSCDELKTMSSVLGSSKPDSGFERTRKQGASGGKRRLQAAAVRWHWRRWMAERQVRHKELGFSWR